MKSPEEIFVELLKARGLDGAESISVEAAKEIFCSHIKYEQQGHAEAEKTWEQHMSRCHAEEYMRAPVGMIESKLREGVALHFPQGCGKTRALLNFVERLPHNVRVAYVGARGEAMRLARTTRRLIDAHPGQFGNVQFIAAGDSFHGDIRGFDCVVVDDWFDLEREARYVLATEARVIAAVGTIRYGEEFPLSGQPQRRGEIEREIQCRVEDEVRRRIDEYTNTRSHGALYYPTYRW